LNVPNHATYDDDFRESNIGDDNAYAEYSVFQRRLLDLNFLININKHTLNFSKFNQVFLHFSSVPGGRFGLYTNVDFEPNDVISEYAGIELSTEVRNRRKKENTFMIDFRNGKGLDFKEYRVHIKDI